MLVSVIIPTHNKAMRLELTLITLLNQDYGNDYFEVIVVDDGSTDNTREVVKKIADEKRIKLIYIYQENMGRAAARNTGINASGGKILIFLDDDRLVNSNFISKHAAVHANSHNSDITVLGKRANLFIAQFEKNYENIKLKILNDPDEIYMKARIEYYWRKIKPAFNMKDIAWITFTTGNTSIRSKLIKDVGMFNEQFKGWGMEDTELGYRLWMNNVRFICNEDIINYHIEHTRSVSERKTDEIRNHNLFYSLHPDKPVELFRKYLYGDISLQKFNDNMTDNISDSEEESYYKMLTFFG